MIIAGHNIQQLSDTGLCHEVMVYESHQIAFCTTSLPGYVLYLVCAGNIDYYVFKLPIHLLLLLKYYGVVPGTSRLALVRALGDLYELPHMEVNVGEGHHWTGRSPAPLPPGMGAARINV